MDLLVNTQEEIDFLRQFGIDVIPENRNYWFVRTQKGTYYEDFVNDGFVGIEWDKISNFDFLNKANEDDLKVEVANNYPKIERPGYPAGQIKRFVKDMKKGDIVLIPNKGSSWISFGEIVEDDIYILDVEDEVEFDFSNIIDDFFDEVETVDEKPVLKKRRKVKWIRQVKRTDLDPYLYDIIHSHQAIVDADRYSVYIDRTLSQFYIKGEEAFYTFKVNKKRNIPYSDTLNFLNTNNRIIEYINKYSEEIKINDNDLILKINVQSKGPIQLKGTVAKILIFGMVTTFLCGAKINFHITGLSYNCETEGISKLITTVNDVIRNNDSDNDKIKEQEALIEMLKKDKEKLQLQIPASKEDQIAADKIDSLTEKNK